MSVASWAAETSGTIGWLSLFVGVLVAVLAGRLDKPWYQGALPHRSVRLSAGVGLLFIAVATLLAALGGGRELWLTALGGILCLAVAMASQFRALQNSIARGTQAHPEPSERPAIRDTRQDLFPTRVIEAMQLTTRLLQRADRLADDLERATAEIAQLGRAEPLVDFPTMARTLVDRGAWAPASVYTSADDGTALKSAVVELLLAFDIAVIVEEPVELSSWFQRFWMRADSESVRERLRKAEQALELQYLGKARAEIDHAKAQAAAALLQALSTQENAVIRIGSLIAIKAQGDLAVWTVSELEAADMERRSALLRDPLSALEYLRRLRERDEPQLPASEDRQ